LINGLLILKSSAGSRPNVHLLYRAQQELSEPGKASCCVLLLLLLQAKATAH